MFTGLILEMGRVERIEEVTQGRRLWVSASSVLDDARPGESISVNGCCLTAVTVERACFAADVIPETLERTTLSRWREGDAVNLERSLRFGDRLGGHWVQGHVDGIGEIMAVTNEGASWRVGLRLPTSLARFIAEKGSLAVDGASLTVASCHGASCEIAYIPHTLAVTVAGRYVPGDRVNLEVDLVARYVARWLEEEGVQRR
jgi:riboflavin synthase